jgi:hypothetical protein
VFPSCVTRVNVAHYVLIFDVADVVTLRTARNRGCSCPGLFASLGFYFFISLFQSAVNFATLFGSLHSLILRNPALEVSNGR